MVGSHHQLNGYEFEQTLGDSEGKGKPSGLQSMGLQRVRHNLATKQQPLQMQASTSAYLNKQVTLIQVLWIRVICGNHPDLTQSIESICLSSREYHQLGSLKQQKFLSHSSGSQRSECQHAQFLARTLV